MIFGDILKWQQLARPNPTETDKNISIGIHLEEVSEYLENLSSNNPEDDSYLSEAACLIGSIADRIKRNDMVVKPLSRIDHADALGDQIVTAIGDMHMQGIDAIGVITEISRSNNSKFEDGLPIFNEDGKVIKGSGYTKPNLTEFV